MRKNYISRRLEEDVWGNITVKAKRNKVTAFFHSLLKEKYNKKLKKAVVFRVDIVKPKRKKLVLSKYGQLLALRRKICLFYGELKKRELIKIIKLNKSKKGNLANNVMNTLESRLEVVIFRLNFASSVKEARQLLRQGVFMVNKEVIKVPSYNVKTGEIIEVVPGYKNKIYLNLLKRLQLNYLYNTVSPYFEVNYRILAGCKINEVKLHEACFPFIINEHYFQSIILNRLT